MKFNSGSMNIWNPEGVAQAALITQDYLTTFAAQEDFNSSLKLAFGNLFNPENIENLRQEWATGSFELLPTVEIRSTAEINGANGAFSKDTNTIYLSQEYITNNATHPQAIASVLLEEIGHFVDAQINLSDAPGDEGAIFSALVRGETLDEQQLQQLRAEDDTATATLDKQVIQIEQATTYTGNNLGEVITGLDGLLDTLQDALDSQVFSNQLPLLGDQLKDSSQSAVQFIKNFEDDILDKLHQSLDGVENKTPELIRKALADALGSTGLGLLQDLNNDGQVNSQDIQIIETADDVKFNLKLSKSITSFNASLDTDIGLPGLGLNVDGSANVGLSYDFNLKFGINRVNGFYIDTSATDELKVGLNASIQNLDATGNLGFLQLDVTNKGTQFNGSFAIDLKDADNQLRSSEIPSVNFGNLINARLNGAADVNLNLVTSFNGSTVLPSIRSDFKLNWDFNNSIANPNQAPTFGSRPTVAFNNVQLNLDSFFNNFAAPILQKVQKFTEPIQPIADILTTPIDIGIAEFNLLDIAEGLGKIDQQDRNYIESAAKIISLVNSIPLDSDLSLNLGSFNFGSADVRATGFNLGNVNPSITASAQALVEGSEKTFITNLKTLPGGGFNLPILDNPSTVFNLLLGKDVTLFTYTTPRLDFNLEYSQFFPIFGPIGAEIKGAIGATVDNIEFGYDTYGLKDFLEGKDTLFDGFFVSDVNAAGVDVPEVTLNASLEAFASLNVAIASVGVGGGIYGNIGFNLNDPNKDGKIRLEEFDQIIRQNPLDLFDTSGQLSAGLSAYAKFGFGPFSYTERFDSPRIVLLSYPKSGTQPQPLLAKDLGGGILQLNMGPNATSRLRINTTDGAEVFTVKHQSGVAGSETVVISAFDISQEYSDVSKIVADGGEENDVITLTADVLTSAEIAGGRGNDLITGGSGSDSLDGGAGLDKLIGGAGNDTLSGGTEDDFLVGGAGADVLDGGEGFDVASYETATTSVSINLATGATTGDAVGDVFVSIEQLEGSHYADSLVGDASANILLGLKGDDSLQGGEGDDLLVGGEGADILEGEAGIDAVSYSSSAIGVSVNLETTTASGGDAQGDVLLSIEHLEGSEQADTLVGNDLDNILSGLGGNDSLDGREGDDLLNGGVGADTLNGGEGIDTVSYITSATGVNVNLSAGTASGGHAQGDVLISIENLVGSQFTDTLVGSIADNIINAGLGLSDQVNGDNGEDLLIIDYSVRDTGTGVISSGSSAYRNVSSTNSSTLDYISYTSIERFQFTGTSKSDRFLTNSSADGTDTLLGGDGDDTLTSYGGDDSLDGGNGNDSLDGGQGNDIINAGAGNDTVKVFLGENSIDQLDGGAGIDTLSADLSHQSVNIVLDSTNPVSELNFANGTRIANFEMFQDIYTGSGNDRLVQLGRLNNDFRTGRGNDIINAGLGASDRVDGGNGEDLLILDYSVEDTGTGITGSGSSAYRQISSTNGNTLDYISYTSIERFQFTGTSKSDRFSTNSSADGTDTLLGGDGDDTLTSYGGDDSLDGGNGNDSLDGGQGNDIINAGAGNDTVKVFLGENSIDQLDGGAGIDTLSADLSHQSVNIVLDSTNPVSELNFANGTRIANFEMFQDIYTGSGNDRLVQLGRLNNDFRTGRGNDIINAGLGASDRVDGGNGEDLLILDYSVEDTGTGITGSGSSAYRQISSTNGNTLDYISYTSIERFQFTGTSKSDRFLTNSSVDGADTLSGGDGDDTLTSYGGNDSLDGGSGNDTLNGGQGNDILIGDFGNDNLTGGGGRDRFLLREGQGTDTITDFEDGLDSLGLAGSLTFEQLTITSSTNNTLISIASSGELIATLTGVQSNLITAADFMII